MEGVDELIKVKDLLDEQEIIDNLVYDKKYYLLQICKNRYLFRINNATNNKYNISITNITSYNSNISCVISINTEKENICYDKLIQDIQSVVYDYKDKSISFYIYEDYIDIEGFYMNTNLNDITKIYFIKSQLEFDNKAYYINKREPVELFENNGSFVFENEMEKEIEMKTIKYNLKRATNNYVMIKKGDLSLEKTREVIKLYYQNDAYNKSGLAKKFGCSITLINKALEMMNSSYVMRGVMFNRKRPMDVNEKSAIMLYKEFKGKPNMKTLAKKAYDDKKCNEKAYKILCTIFAVNGPTPYAKYLLQYAISTKWL